MVTVLVRELEFYAYHGFTDEEQAIGHRYLLSLEVLVATKATESDTLSDTVDYGDLAKVALAAATEPKARLVELVAHRVATAVLEAFPEIAEVEVELVKLLPPMPFVAQSAGVRIVKSR